MHFFLQGGVGFEKFNFRIQSYEKVETSMEPPWNLHGTFMEPPWNLHGNSMEPPWNLHGTSMEPASVSQLAPPTIETGNAFKTNLKTPRNLHQTSMQWKLHEYSIKTT